MSEFKSEDLEEVIKNPESSLVQLLAIQLKATTQKRDTLAAENYRMKKSIKRIFPEGVGGEHRGIGFSEASKECYASATESPATDAILNAVRAEGVVMAINKLKALDASPFAIHSLECSLYELHAGAAKGGNDD